MKATWNGTVIAESDDTIVVERSHYFHPSSLDRRLVQESSKQSVCPWKGMASYYSIVVEGDVNSDAAWYYPTPKDAANNITGYVAFWRGVTVSA
jgi:uncharacterized protein (DUF427 family)